MPVCPNCGYEYVKGITFCPDCNESLVDENLYLKPEEWKEDNWVVAFTSNQEYEIEMLKNNLDGAGITSAILDQKDRNFPSPGDFSVVKLMVKKEDLHDALNFIQAVLNVPDKDEPESE
ncbi:MAG: zinc-ribbon domain-containing protein [Ignavibacteriaceae bacterium]|nr:zinc-ribbon domain-containing protein [Ignavibacteriaceae bacterium]